MLCVNCLFIRFADTMRIPYLKFLALPSLFYFLGAATNSIVMGVNDGMMPVQWPGGCGQVFDGIKDQYHTCLTHQTHLKVLADWIVINAGVASPGDMFIYLGDWLWHPFLYGWIGMVLVRFADRIND
jgi:hypothetical protein